MREIIIVTDSVLAAIGFVCICLSADTYEKSISKALRKIVFPGRCGVAFNIYTDRIIKRGTWRAFGNINRGGNGTAAVYSSANAAKGKSGCLLR